MEILFVLLLIIFAVIAINFIFRDSSPKISQTKALLAERKKSLIERRKQLLDKEERTEDESIELDRFHKEIQALEQRIDSFNQLHKVIDLFSSHDNLDNLIRQKELRSKSYLAMSLSLFLLTIVLAMYFTVSVYYETWTWIRLVELTQESKVALVIAVSPVAYSLLLALLFMRFHQKAEEDLTPHQNERVKWSTIYKILVAAEMVGATEPTENLVLETFLQLRGLALGMQSPTKSPTQTESVQQKEREVVVSPADVLLRVVQALAGVRTLQS